MKTQQFIHPVCKMRSAQKQFFRTRLHDDMDQAKQLERKVDQALRSFSDEEEHQLFIQHFDPS